MNQNYFKTWSPNMAWLLGYMYANGCVFRPVKKESTLGLGFSVQIKDEEILSFIKVEYAK